ncbi:MAG: D-alanine--D-alanine ligase, partial [Deltaproteobacteria bacterium]|nr:D-alanine--D-alanine ligase [Deltaproteobacteria bacterium]
MSATVVILHQSLPQDAAPDDKDVLIQASSVADALEHLGYRAVIEPFELDIAGFSSRLSLLDPVCVFNLVESLDNDGRLIHLACSILDHLGVPYTGANAEAMFLTSNKVLAKRWMLLAGIPTPEWVVRGTAPECGLPVPAKYIVTPLWEEASIGLDQGSVQEAADMAGLMDLLENRSLMLGRKCFAERFIDGREFNLSMLARSDGAEVLPPAEIVFT